jgi:hypothetical protein
LRKKAKPAEKNFRQDFAREDVAPDDNSFQLSAFGNLCGD